MKATVYKRQEKRDGTLGQWSIFAVGEALQFSSSSVRVKSFPSPRKGNVGFDEWFSLDSARVKVELEPISLTDSAPNGRPEPKGRRGPYQHKGK